MGGAGRRREEQFDHRARGSGGEGQRRGGEVAHHILADLLGHLRHFHNPGLDQGIPLAESANRGGTLQVIVQPAGREHLGRIVPIGLQRLLAVG